MNTGNTLAMGKLLCSYAFRPFFLLNPLFALIAVGLWVTAWAQGGFPGLPADMLSWHIHEMVIGFAGAAIAGFLFTAAAAWTGRPPLSGGRLALLIAAWLAGRAGMLAGGFLPDTWVLILDMLFPVAMAMFAVREIAAGRSRRNYGIAAVTLAIAGLNLYYHLGGGLTALYLLIYLLLVLITVIGGRIVPAFTGNWLRSQGVSRLPETTAAVEALVLPVTAAAGLFASLAPGSRWTAGLMLLAAVLHAMRLLRWRGWSTRREPLLFVLHAAYAWLPAGFLLTALAALGLLPATAAIHVLTVGAISGMILAVASRVALGHTGRRLYAGPLTVAAYQALAVAVLLRVIAPLWADAYLPLVVAAAAAWALAFIFFLIEYWPMLTGPRVQTA